MGDLVGYKLREGVAVISVDNPPINALSQPVRAGVLHAVSEAIADPEVRAIVIQAEGRTFPAGADLRDFHARVEAPALGEVCRAIEESPKPVLAAIHGTALGGGFELALACHYRLAQAGTQLGLPDVALGAVPAAGASQRLPRLVGANTALDMLISARPISAEGAARIGLVDKVVQKNLARAAFGSARNMATAGTGPRPTCDRREGMADPAAFLAAVAERRRALADDPRDAARKAVDLVEAAALLPFETGLEFERVSFEDLVESDQARGLRHAFLAERRTLRGPAFSPARARPVGVLGVVGAGARAISITRAALAGKRRVVLHDADEQALAAAVAALDAALADAVEAGALSPEKQSAQRALLSASPDPEALGPCDVIIEALEDGDRAATFARLGLVAAPNAMLASAGAPDPEALETCAEASGRPEQVIGLRFPYPIEETRLVEVLRRPNGADDLGATAAALAQALGKVPVFPARPAVEVVAPLLQAVWRAALWLVEEGASPLAIDNALRGWGFGAGPFEMMDRAGLDRLGFTAPLIDAMIAQGLEGEAAGEGFYSWGAGTDRADLAPGVSELTIALRHALRLTPRTLSDDEITGRIHAALVNAGAALVADGAAARPSDIDAAMVLGYGFPRWRGGPMEAADLAGLLKLRNQMRAWAAGRDGALWHPNPLFDELIKNGRGFNSLNR